MGFIDFKVDDKQPDGSMKINWDRRAHLVVALGKCAEMSLEQVLEGINNSEFAQLVKVKWEEYARTE